MRVTGETPFQEPRLERWYVDLYLTELEQSLGDYIARLAYAEDWTWFDASGNALSDSEVAAMTDADRTEAFISGAYAKEHRQHLRWYAGRPRRRFYRRSP